MIRYIFLTSLFIAFPEIVYAWGPMTHSYLAGEVLKYGSLIPHEVWIIISNFRHDFLYGNLMADIIIGKKYMPKEKQSHNWDFAFNLMEKASAPSEKAFMYGFLCHLAADTVAHRVLTKEKIDLEHTWIEFMADTFIGNDCRFKTITIKKAVQQRNDHFLKKGIEPFIFSFNTNKKIFKGFLIVSAILKKKTKKLNHQMLKDLHDQSLFRMLNVLTFKKDSP
ncbi:MAG TPA: zinc dependent phospholipase C family protein, partial [Nitrospirae bacterium]|nr:zinc dependent phospholipase C family protein [Nitrospirota bacterium]